MNTTDSLDSDTLGLLSRGDDGERWEIECHISIAEDGDDPSLNLEGIGDHPMEDGQLEALSLQVPNSDYGIYAAIYLLRNRLRGCVIYWMKIGDRFIRPEEKGVSPIGIMENEIELLKDAIYVVLNGWPSWC